LKQEIDVILKEKKTKFESEYLSTKKIHEDEKVDFYLKEEDLKRQIDRLNEIIYDYEKQISDGVDESSSTPNQIPVKQDNLIEFDNHSPPKRELVRTSSKHELTIVTPVLELPVQDDVLSSEGNEKRLFNLHMSIEEILKTEKDYVED